VWQAEKSGSTNDAINRDSFERTPHPDQQFPRRPSANIKKEIHMKKITVVALASILTLSGCATQPGGPNGEANTNSSGQNAVAGAMAGAAAGCALAVLLHKKCADGAIAGGTIGAALGWASTSSKTASSQQVNDQARRAGVVVPVNEVRCARHRQRRALAARCG
jgi:hypothetical protein